MDIMDQLKNGGIVTTEYGIVGPFHRRRKMV